MSTGFSEKLISEDLSEEGISHVLMKPIALKDLAKTVRSALDRGNPKKMNERNETVYKGKELGITDPLDMGLVSLGGAVQEGGGCGQIAFFHITTISHGDTSLSVLF